MERTTTTCATRRLRSSYCLAAAFVAMGDKKGRAKRGTGERRRSKGALTGATSRTNVAMCSGSCARTLASLKKRRQLTRNLPCGCETFCDDCAEYYFLFEASQCQCCRALVERVERANGDVLLSCSNPSERFRKLQLRHKHKGHICAAIDALLARGVPAEAIGAGRELMGRRVKVRMLDGDWLGKIVQWSSTRGFHIKLDPVEGEWDGCVWMALEPADYGATHSGSTWWLIT